jgi:hypothetical protein
MSQFSILLVLNRTHSFSLEISLHVIILFSIQVRGSKGKAIHDQALINCQYSMAVFSTGERRRRPRGDRKSVEMTLHLKQTFEAAILTNLYPRSQIDIFIEASTWFTCTCNCNLQTMHRTCFLMSNHGNGYVGFYCSSKIFNFCVICVLCIKFPFLFLGFTIGWRQLLCQCKRCYSCSH